MPRKPDPMEEAEKERQEMMEAEREIGRNLPEAFHGVEGADVREVHRHHEEEDKEEGEEPSE